MMSILFNLFFLSSGFVFNNKYHLECSSGIYNNDTSDNLIFNNSFSNENILNTISVSNYSETHCSDICSNNNKCRGYVLYEDENITKCNQLLNVNKDDTIQTNISSQCWRKYISYENSNSHDIHVYFYNYYYSLLPYNTTVYLDLKEMMF